MLRRVLVLAALTAFLAGGAEAAVPKIQMLDSLLVSQGTTKVNLVKGTVAGKVKLAPLPAVIQLGTPEEFTATIYKAYLTSSTDAAVEIPLGNLYPTTKGTAAIKAALKGDVSLLGLDRVVVVAFSKDGLSSFDVLTGTIPVE